MTAPPAACHGSHSFTLRNEGMKAGPLSKDRSTVTVLFPWLSQETALKTDSQSSLSLTDCLSGSSFMVSPVRDSPVLCS